jgi:hypothetical protein
MSTILKYDVVDAGSVDHLVRDVQERISQGWQPLGGPFYLSGSFFQAMVWTDEAEEHAAQIARAAENQQRELELIEELTEVDDPIRPFSDRFEYTPPSGIRG